MGRGFDSRKKEKGEGRTWIGAGSVASLSRGSTGTCTRGRGEPVHDPGSLHISLYLPRDPTDSDTSAMMATLTSDNLVAGNYNKQGGWIPTR